MASYLYQITYSAEAWAALVKRPQDRVEAIRKVVENLGGKIEAFWFAFGITTWSESSTCRTMPAPLHSPWPSQQVERARM